jgi:hypothetical protein
MSLGKIENSIKSYVEGRVTWKSFGDFFEDIMIENKHFDKIFPLRVVLILEDILSDVHYSDFWNSSKGSNPYLIDEKEFKLRLRKNFEKLKDCERG